MADRGRSCSRAIPSTRASPTTSPAPKLSPAAATDAIEHLRQAIERSERFSELARDDSDFDSIRDEPAFKELVGG